MNWENFIRFHKKKKEKRVNKGLKYIVKSSRFYGDQYAWYHDHVLSLEERGDNT